MGHCAFKKGGIISDSALLGLVRDIVRYQVETELNLAVGLHLRRGNQLGKARGGDWCGAFDEAVDGAS